MDGLWGEMGFRRESPLPPSALPVVAAARAITNRGDRRRIGRVLRHSLPAAPQRQRITGITALAEFPSQRILISGAEEQKGALRIIWSHNKARLWRIALYFCHGISRMTDPMWRILLSFPLRCSKIPPRSSCSRWKKNGGRECRDLDGAMQMNFICITGCF